MPKESDIISSPEQLQALSSTLSSSDEDDDFEIIHSSSPLVPTNSFSPVFKRLGNSASNAVTVDVTSRLTGLTHKSERVSSILETPSDNLGDQKNRRIGTCVDDDIRIIKESYENALLSQEEHITVLSQQVNEGIAKAKELEEQLEAITSEKLDANKKLSENEAELCSLRNRDEWILQKFDIFKKSGEFDILSEGGNAVESIRKVETVDDVFKAYRSILKKAQEQITELKSEALKWKMLYEEESVQMKVILGKLKDSEAIIKALNS